MLVFCHLSLHHIVSLSSHSEDKVKDVKFSLLTHHLHHALDADQSPSTTNTSTEYKIMAEKKCIIIV